MSDWPDERFLALSGARLPIVQAPMAGAGGVELAVGAIGGGAVGSLPCALLTPDEICSQAEAVRAQVEGPLNLNFFCHHLPDPPDETEWRTLLEPYYREEGVSPALAPPLRRPFGAAECEAVEQVRPEMVSFHFGLPEAALLARVRATGARIAGNATTPAEARWLEEAGCDLLIVQAAEAGGHSGWFLEKHRPMWLPYLLRAVAVEARIPIIAAGGIVDGTGIADAMRIGAAAVQIGTAYLATPESGITAPHRALLGTGTMTEFTTLFSGRPARGIRNRLMRELGRRNPAVPPFPYASAALAPLRAHAEAEGRGDYSPLWAGTNMAHVRPMPAQALTALLAEEGLAELARPLEVD